MKTREIKVTSGNRITIPFDIRSSAKWFKEGEKIKVSLVDADTIVIKPIRAKPLKVTVKRKKKRLNLSQKLLYIDEINWLLGGNKK